MSAGTTPSGGTPSSTPPSVDSWPIVATIILTAALIVSRYIDEASSMSVLRLVRTGDARFGLGDELVEGVLATTPLLVGRPSCDDRGLERAGHELVEARVEVAPQG